MTCVLGALQVNAQQWHNIGPMYAPIGAEHLTGVGRISAIAFSSQDTNKVFLGGAGGGVWMFDMHKDSAYPLGFDTIAPFIGIGALAVDPWNEKHIIASTGEHMGPYDWADNWSSSTGIYITSNMGIGWHRAVIYGEDNNPTYDFDYGQFNYNRIPKIIINPQNPRTVWCVSHGFLYDANADFTHLGHIYVSHDGGETWRSVKSNAFNDTYFGDIVYDPRDTTVIYAASHYLYQSKDGGHTWIDITARLAKYTPLKTSASRLVVSATPLYAHEPMVGVLAVFPDARQNKLYTTATYFDSTVSPVGAKNMGYARLSSKYKCNLCLSGLTDTLYIGGDVLEASYDGGKTFTRYQYEEQTHPDIHCLAVSPHKQMAGYVFAGTDGGLYISRDEGKHYYPHFKGSCFGMFTSVAASDTRRRIAGGTQDLGSLRCDNDSAWVRMNGGGDGNNALFCPHTADTLIYGDFQGNEVFLSYDGGENYKSYDIPGGHWIPGAWTFSPQLPMRIYTGGNDVWKISSKFPNPIRLSNFKKLDSSGYDKDIKVTGIAVSVLDSNTIYVTTTGQWVDAAGHASGIDKDVNYNDAQGYSRHFIYKTTDGGHTWQDISPQILAVAGEATSIALSTTSKKTIWITHTKWSSKTYSNINVYMSKNGGKRWELYSDGLPAVPTNKIICTPGDVLYLATNEGIFMRKKSRDEWVNISGNIPHVPIRDIAYSTLTHSLYAATWGRGIWCISTDKLLSH